MMDNINKIKELCGRLDADIYGKNCNFIADDADAEIEFYSRDYCRNITFKELIKWYIERINCNQYDENYQDDYLQDFERNIEILIELIEAYSIEKTIRKLNKAIAQL